MSTHSSNNVERSYLLTYLILALTFLAGNSIAAEQKLFDYQQTQLDNGMDVITLEDFSSPIVSVQVWYHVGSRNEDPARQGFAHMFEHMMFKGTDLVSEEDHFNSIHKVGGYNNAWTSFDKTVYVQTVPVDKIEMVLWLEAERMTHLSINQNTFDTERNVVLEELRMKFNKPYGTSFQKIMNNLYTTHPYHWTPIGNIEHLRATSVPELRAFWKKYYVPNNATLIVVGAIKHKDAQELAQQYFGWIPKYDDPTPVIAPEPPQTEPKTIVIDDENAPAAQAQIIWRTVPAGNKDVVALDLLSNVLGGGNSSRLYRQLVADKQLAVETSAWVWNLQDDGLFGMDATQTPDATAEEILAIFKEQLNDIKKNGVTDTELQKARNRALKSTVTQNLTVSSKSNVLGQAAVIEGNVENANSILDDIKAVTADDIKRVANQYLTDNSSNTIIIKENKDGEKAITKANEEAPITAETEEVAPPTGRGDAPRPDGWPMQVPIGDIKAYKSTPKYTTDTLDNGMKVIVVPNHEVPFVGVHLGFLSGAWSEQKPGEAAMAMEMLSKGTRNFTEAQLAEELELYAIDLNGSAGMDTSSVSVDCLTEYLPRAMRMLGEVVFNPIFDEEEFAKLKKRTITELSISEETPRYLVDKQFRKVLYGSHPYSRTVTGEQADVESLAINDLKRWYASAATPDKATLIFAGDIERDRALELSKEIFASWAKALPQPEVALADIPQPQSSHIYIVDRPGSMQSEIRIGTLGMTRRVEPDYFVARVVSEYFGGSFHSRLNNTLRVEKGLTYGSWATFSPQNLAGQFRVATFTKTESTAEAVQVIFDLLKQLTQQPPTDEELNTTKSYQAGSFVVHRETPQSVAEDLWMIQSQNLSPDYLDKYLAGIAATTKDDCIELIKKYIDPDKMAVIITGDAEEIKEPLEQIAPVTVIED